MRRKSIREPERIGAFVNSVCNIVVLEYQPFGGQAHVEDGPPDQADERADSERELVTREEQARVRSVLQRISDKNRRLLAAVFLEERTPAEVCRQFKVDGNYLRVLLFRARAQFRQALEREKDATARKS